MNRIDMIIAQLDEKFCGGFKNTWKDYYQVFCNPTSNELREIDNNAVRFIAEPLSKTLYVWDVGKALHGHVLHELIQTNKTTREDALKGVWGVALKKGNKLKFSDSDTLSGLNLKALKELMNYDWRWLEKYMSGVVGELQRLIANYPNSSYRSESRVDKILTQIDETFCKGFQSDSGYVEVYCDPTLQEMIEAGDKIRFIAIHNKKMIVVANANKVIHWDIKEELNLKTTFRKDIWGVAERKGNKYYMTSSDDIDTYDTGYDIAEGLLSKDWQWAEKKIKGITEYLENRIKKGRYL